MKQPALKQSPHDESYPLPIYVFLTALILWVISAALIAEPELQAIPTAGTISALMVVHLVLNWYSPRLLHREVLWMQYGLAQAGLAIALGVATGNPSVWAVLFTWLIGEAVGLLDNPRLTALTLSLYGLLSVAALFAITDSTTALEWMGAIVPTMLFVGLVVVLYKRQVEAREQAQRLVEELESANRQISAFAERVEQLTLTNERQRMAREFHDTLSQDVAGLVLQLEAVVVHIDAARYEKAQSIVRQAMSRARSTLHDARAAIDNLRTVDARARLSERLHDLVQTAHADSEVAFDLSINLGIWDSALPVEHKEQLERIVSEALTNVRKHAQATRVSLHVQAGETRLTLEVKDNGVGFAESRLSEKGHYGLRGMRERAVLLGGTLDIQSAPGAGTTVILEMPLRLPSSTLNGEKVSS